MAKSIKTSSEESRDKARKERAEGKPGPDDLAVEALESISRDQFEASWKKVDFNAKGRPVGEVLRGLAQAVGRTLKTTPIQDRALASSLAIEVRGLSRYRAIDEVTRSVGLLPIDSTPGTMRLRPRRGPRLAAFAGPFLFEVEDIKEAVPYATAILTLKVAASGLPPTVLTTLDRPQDTFIVTEVVDAKGRSLLDTEAAAVIGSSWMTSPAGEYAQSRRVPLKGLLREVSAIKTLRCKVRISLPARVETIRFDTLKPGATRKEGDLEVTLKTPTQPPTSFDRTPVESRNLAVVFARKNPDRAKRSEPVKKDRPAVTGLGPDRVKLVGHDRVKLVGHDAQGRPLKTTPGYWIPQSGNSSETLNVTIEGPATALVAKVIADVDEVVYEFRREDIPLASYASMPERIEPAGFPGHQSPVTVEFVSNPMPTTGPSGGMGLPIGGGDPFPNAQLRVTNHSNKDIRMLGMKLDYLSPDGRRFGGWDKYALWESGWRFGTGPPGAKPILLPRGSQSVIGINAPLFPGPRPGPVFPGQGKPGTNTIAVTVQTVGFADAETWHAPGLPKK
jgi:hypothetical protein